VALSKERKKILEEKMKEARALKRKLNTANKNIEKFRQEYIETQQKIDILLEEQRRIQERLNRYIKESYYGRMCQVYGRLKVDIAEMLREPP